MANFVFMSHCILAQTIMAGDKSCGPQVVKPVLKWVMENDINVEQMPCPEALFVGVERKPQGFKHYNTPEFRRHCMNLARGQVAWMLEIERAGHTVLGVLGVVFSPACSTIKDSPSNYHPYGVYMDELEKLTLAAGLKLKFVCVTEKWGEKLKQSLTELEDVMKRPKEADDV